MAVERKKSQNRLRECKRCGNTFKTPHKYGKICSKCALSKSDYNNTPRIRHLEEILSIDKYLQSQKQNTKE